MKFAFTIESRVKQISFLIIGFLYLMITASELLAAPVILDAGMSPNQYEWPFDRNAFGADKEVKFWLCVQRQGNLNQYGTFDYYFKIRVFRPDGQEVWNTVYGFNEEGYAEEKFIFPTFFYDRSPNKLSPLFGIWKIRMAVWDKNSQREMATKEYSIAFTDGKQQSSKPAVSSTKGNGNPFPVPSFQYGGWRLKNWGIGIYDEVSTGPNTYDKEIRQLESRNKFTIKEVSGAWSKGRKFGAVLEGPPVNTCVDSNNLPLYVFSYRLKHPNGEIEGQNPQYRSSSYCNNPGTALFPFDLRKAGNYHLDFLLREREKPSWEESSWVLIGGIDFTLTE